jgi:hypothetical protein
MAALNFDIDIRRFRTILWGFHKDCYPAACFAIQARPAVFEQSSLATYPPGRIPGGRFPGCLHFVRLRLGHFRQVDLSEVVSNAHLDPVELLRHRRNSIQTVVVLNRCTFSNEDTLCSVDSRRYPAWTGARIPRVRALSGKTQRRRCERPEDRLLRLNRSYAWGALDQVFLLRLT